MVKAYLRYEQTASFGVVSSNCNVVTGASGKSLIAASLENISVWNVKTGTLEALLAPAATGGPTAPAEVTRLALSPDRRLLAAGHADGSIRLWDLDSRTCLSSLDGHRRPVTVLRFSQDGALIASGSQDTDIILWDAVAQTGLFRLRGHRDQVTDLLFISGQHKLVSASKDSYVRVWDLHSQHCQQTIIGHKGAVWALALAPDETRLVAGSSTQELLVYSVRGPDSPPAARGSPGGEVLTEIGAVRRDALVAARTASLVFDPRGELLVCTSAGKAVELFRVRSPDEARRKMKRRKKRKREKVAGEGGEGAHEGGGPSVGESTAQPPEEGEAPRAADEIGAERTVHFKHKVKSVAVWEEGPPAGSDAIITLVGGLANNSIQVLEVSAASERVCHSIAMQGHRADVRTVTLAGDDSLLATTSNAGVKVWNPRTGACVRTIDEAGYGLSAVFAPGNRHLMVGTKDGALELLHLGASALASSTPAHDGPVWSLAALPDGTGFVSGSADHSIKFWKWVVQRGAQGEQQVSVELSRTLRMQDDVLCVRLSPDGSLLAAALLDCTIKVFHTDTLAFFLSLYGHKLPVLSLDISSDGALLVSGSADKNIKVWGLDFGDCHKSLFAHQDSVMGVAFVPHTHYAFSVGKDRLLKYWDLDKRELLLELPGHHAEVWGLAVAAGGDFAVTCGHDRSVRRWDRTEESFFVQEEQEKRLESLFDEGGEAEAGTATRGPPDGETSVGPASRPTTSTLSAADSIIDSLDTAAHESEKLASWRAQVKAGRGGGGGEAGPRVQRPPPNPLMLGQTPGGFVLAAVTRVRASELEQALLALPFSDALKLLGYAEGWLAAGQAVERTAQAVVLLLRLHHQQLVTAAAARPMLLRLQRHLQGALSALKDALGFNMAAGRHLAQLREAAGGGTPSQMLPVKRALDGKPIKGGA